MELFCEALEQLSLEFGVIIDGQLYAPFEPLYYAITELVMRRLVFCCIGFFCFSLVLCGLVILVRCIIRCIRSGARSKSAV